MVQHINLLKLASQDRAYSATRPWSEAELKALLSFQQELGLSRTEAAQYVRNGIMTIEEHKRAVEIDFKPKTLEEVQSEAMKNYLEDVEKQLHEVEVEVVEDEEEPVPVEKKAAKKKK